MRHNPLSPIKAWTRIGCAALFLLALSCESLAPELLIVLSQPAVHFRTVRGSTTTLSQAITIQNGGDGRLGPASCPPAPASWLGCAVTNGNSVTLTANPSGLSTSPAPVSVPISAPGAKEPQTVVVDLVLDQPVLSLSVGNVSFTATEGSPGTSPATATVTVANTGAGGLPSLGVLSCAPVPATTRITCAVNQGTGTLTLSVDTNGLLPGTYVFPVVVSSPNNTVSQTVTVSVVVSALARIVLTPSVISFSAIRGTTTAQTRTVIITNSGSGTLGALSCPGNPTVWLTCSISGSTLTLTATAAGLAVSPAAVSVPVSGTSASNSPQNLSVSLSIEQPILTVSKNAVSFTAQEGLPGTTPATDLVAVTNSGVGTLANLGTITCVPTTATAPVQCLVDQATGTLTLTVSPLGLTAGIYVYDVLVSAPNSGVTRTITVTLSVAGQARLVLSPNNVRFNALRGSTAPVVQTVAISNKGSGSLGTITCAANPAPWLACVVTDTTTLTFTANPTGLIANPANVVVPISASLAVNSPQNVTVGLTIDQPVLSLSSNYEPFSATGGVSTPASKIVMASNVGAGVLADLGGLSCVVSNAHLGCAVNQLTGALTLTVSQNLPAPALTPGTYVFTATVSAPNSANSPQTIVVVVTVT